MSLKVRRLLHLTIFIVLGLLIRTAIVDVYFAGKSNKFRSLLTGDLLSDHIPLANVSLLAGALHEIASQGDPQFVHLFFAVHYLLQHIFPPPYLAVLFSFLHFFPWLSFPEDIILLVRDEFNLNVLAGALYGPWLGTLLCALLTGLACSLTFALVAAIRALTRPLLSGTVWSRKIALYNELVDISSELEAVSERLATVTSSSAGNISAEYRELKLRTEALKRHHLETVLRGLRLQQTEFASGDMQECSLVERYLFGTAEEEVNEVFLDVLVDRAFQSASLASLLYATVQYPPMVTAVASAIGYLPYAFYGVSKGARLMTSVSGGGGDQQQQQQQSLHLLEDQAPRFRFHLGVFFFLLWLTPFLLQMATLKREQYRNNVLINRWHLRNVRRALGEMDGHEEEEVEEIAPVPAAEAVADGPLDDIDDEEEVDGHGEQQEQLNELDNLEIDPDFLLL